MENLVEITWSHLAGITSFLSILLKDIPEFGDAGFIVIFEYNQEWRPMPLKVTESESVKLFIILIIIGIRQKYYFIIVKLCILFD